MPIYNSNYPSPGFGNVGSYQISGLPYLTGSDITATNPNQGQVKITFPRVVRSITVTNTGSIGLCVHFDSRENSDVITYKHYALLAASGDAWAFNVRVKEVYVSAYPAAGGGGFSLVAELTNISYSECPTMSGSGINSVG